MITHIVLFEPPAAWPADARRALLEQTLQGLAGIPTVRGCRVGRRVTHGLPGYEQLMRTDFQYALILEFDSIEGLRAYLTHPAHAALGQAFGSGAAALAYDYEMVDLEDAARLR